MPTSGVTAIQYPDPFLEVRVAHLDPPPPLTGLCAGFSAKKWRSRELGEYLFQWVPFAALNQESQLRFGAHNFLEMLKVATKHVYSTNRTVTRGELGEILLHLACVVHFGTLPIVCK